MATGEAAHAEGSYSTASGANSHAGGNASASTGDNSFAHGNNVRATSAGGFASGSYNVLYLQNTSQAPEGGYQPNENWDYSSSVLHITNAPDLL